MSVSALFVLEKEGQTVRVEIKAPGTHSKRCSQTAGSSVVARSWTSADLHFPFRPLQRLAELDNKDRRPQVFTRVQARPVLMQVCPLK